MSKFKGVKTNNAKTNAKKNLRENIFNKVDNPVVLEVFCGAGEMYNEVWHKADGYTGIDIVKFFDKRKTICGDALKAVSSIDISSYNVFDIDAYGSPYDVLSVIIDRCSRNHEKIAFIITDGVSMDLRLGRICKGLRSLTGIDFHIAKKAAIIHEDLILSVIETIEEKLQMTHSDFKIARGKTGAGMKYYAFVLTKNAV